MINLHHNFLFVKNKKIEYLFFRVNHIKINYINYDSFLSEQNSSKGRDRYC